MGKGDCSGKVSPCSQEDKALGELSFQCSPWASPPLGQGLCSSLQLLNRISNALEIPPQALPVLLDWTTERQIGTFQIVALQSNMILFLNLCHCWYEPPELVVLKKVTAWADDHFTGRYFLQKISEYNNFFVSEKKKRFFVSGKVSILIPYLNIQLIIQFQVKPGGDALFCLWEHVLQDLQSCSENLYQMQNKFHLPFPFLILCLEYSCSNRDR